ncbi:hypothetical protein [Phaffia rhodozyma]|uniref:Transmembrane protein n=1 Tax=Phaffia rhodozyma TaxID=264483 RepID=A0A0F7SIQ8_PHARH|nr:hypothetical protein [Phaffia rhodozyma]
MVTTRECNPVYTRVTSTSTPQYRILVISRRAAHLGVQFKLLARLPHSIGSSLDRVVLLFILSSALNLFFFSVYFIVSTSSQSDTSSKHVC